MMGFVWVKRQMAAPVLLTGGTGKKGAATT